MLITYHFSKDKECTLHKQKDHPVSHFLVNIPIFVKKKDFED